MFIFTIAFPYFNFFRFTSLMLRFLKKIFFFLEFCAVMAYACQLIGIHLHLDQLSWQTSSTFSSPSYNLETLLVICSVVQFPEFLQDVHHSRGQSELRGACTVNVAAKCSQVMCPSPSKSGGSQLGVTSLSSLFALGCLRSIVLDGLLS